MMLNHDLRPQPVLRRRNALIVLVICLPILSWGQGGAGPLQRIPIDFRGQVGMYTDIYLARDNNAAGSASGRPPLMSRWSLDAKVDVWKFSIPVKVTLGLPGGGFGMIRIPDPNLKQYLQMPGNRLGIQPTYKSLRLFLGTHTAKVSPLTAGNVPFVTGIGAHWNPWGVLQLKASYGITQQNVERDTVNRIAGAYKREMLAAQFGFGKEKESHFFLNYVRVKDELPVTDSAAIHSLPVRAPVDGAVIAMDLGVKLGRRMYFKTETALSVFSVDRRDTLATEYFDDEVRYWLGQVGKVLPLNNSTRLGLAADAKVAYKGRNWDWGLKGLVYSPGYQSLAFVNLLDDRAEVSGDGSARMFNNRLTLQGGSTARLVGLFHVQRQPSLQLQFNGMVNLLLFKRLNMALNYLEFTLQNFPIGRTSTLQQRTRNFSFSPSMSFGKSYVQTFALQVGLDALEEVNASAEAAHNQGVSIGLSHSLTLPSHMGVHFSLNGYQNQGDSAVSQKWNVSLGVQGSYWKERLQASAQLQSFFPSESGSLQFGLNGTARLKVNPKMNTNLSIMVLPPNPSKPHGPSCLIRHAFTYNF